MDLGLALLDWVGSFLIFWIVSIIWDRLGSFGIVWDLCGSFKILLSYIGIV